MSTEIALILDGNNSDLYSSLYATELAKRVGAHIHVIIVPTYEPSNDTKGNHAAKKTCTADLMDSLKIVIRLGVYKQIKISSYIIETNVEDILIEFLKQRHIFCLITGANDEGIAKEKKEWLDRIKIRLTQDNKYHLKPFWTLVATPWKDKIYYHMLEKMELWRQKIN